MRSPARESSSAPGAPLAVGALLLAGVLWGLTWMPMRYFGSHGLTGPMLTLTSYGLVGLAALPWLAWRLRTWWPRRTHAVLIGLAGGAGNLCFVSAMLTGEVVRVMLLFYLAPVWGVLGGRLILGEPLTRLRIASVLLALGGAFLLLGGFDLAGTAASWVDLLAVGSGLFYATQNIFTRAAGDLPLDAKALVVFVGCAILSAAVVWSMGATPPPLSGAMVGQLFGFAGIWMLAAMLFTAWGVSRLEAGRAAVLLVFELVVAVISAMWIAGERLDGLEWAGAALITGAALLEAFPAESIVQTGSSA